MQRVRAADDGVDDPRRRASTAPASILPKHVATFYETNGAKLKRKRKQLWRLWMNVLPRSSAALTRRLPHDGGMPPRATAFCAAASIPECLKSGAIALWGPRSADVASNRHAQSERETQRRLPMRGGHTLVHTSF